MRGLPDNKTLEERFGRPTLLQSLTLVNASTSYRTSELPVNARIMIQCGSVLYFKIGDSTVTSTTSISGNAIVASSNEKAYITLMGSKETYIAATSTTAGAILNVFLME